MGVELPDSLHENIFDYNPFDDPDFNLPTATESNDLIEPQTVSSIEAGSKMLDDFGLPIDPEGLYNGAALQFEEMAEILWDITSLTHYAATRYNRHSPNYFSLIEELEKEIRQMGSICITKAVLEKSGTEFSKLVKLSVHELHCMISLHFRKCCFAYQDLLKDGKGQDLSLVKWMFRWAKLCEQLQATEVKIRSIQSGELNVDILLRRAEVYKDDQRIRSDRTEQRINPIRKAKALPIMKSFSNKIIQETKQAEQNEQKKRREARRAAERLKKGGLFSPGTYRSDTYPPMPAPKIPGIGVTYEKLNEMLVDEAKSRGAFEEAERISRETEEETLARYDRMRNQVSGVKDQIESKNLRTGTFDGPSEETRKKLRNRRKKRKK